MPLLRLPDEILLQIIRQCNDDKARPWWSNPSPLFSLSLASSRINTLAESQLYSNIRLDVRHVNQELVSGDRFCSLINALKAKPIRYLYIERLEVEMREIDQTPDPSNIANQNLIEIIHKAVHLRSIKLGCDANHLSSPLFELLDSKNLEKLIISSIQILPLTKPGILKNLKFLQLNNISGARLGRQAGEEPEDPDRYDVQWWGRYVLAEERRAISPVEHLTVKFSQSTPCALLALLPWIAGLKTISINFGLRDRDILDVSHFSDSLDEFRGADLQRILNIHSSTIEKVTLTSYSPDFCNEPVPDFHQFTNLRSLRVSQSELRDDDAEDVAWKLSAPLLTKFVVDFDKEHPEEQKLKEFKVRHYSWFKDFGAEYRSIVPKGGISQIQLVNVRRPPDGDDRALQRTRTALKAHQIAFSWNTWSTYSYNDLLLRDVVRKMDEALEKAE